MYLPILVLLPGDEPGTNLLRAGFDDVLRIPINKSDLAARLDVFLRLRAHSKAQYQSLLEMR